MKPSHLTAGQHALLREALVQRMHQLDSQLARHHEGLSRSEHAHQVLEQDGDDAPQRDSDREVDMALSDMETVELGEVSRALARLEAADGDDAENAHGRYGRCSSCGTDIAFDRLRVKPWASLCLSCAEAQERKQAKAR